MLIILLLSLLTILLLSLINHFEVAKISSIGLLIILSLTILDYIGDCYNAKYINAKYNTNYSADDIFYNEKYIEKELKIDKKSLDN